MDPRDELEQLRAAARAKGLTHAPTDTTLSSEKLELMRLREQAKGTPFEGINLMELPEIGAMDEMRDFDKGALINSAAMSFLHPDDLPEVMAALIDGAETFPVQGKDDEGEPFTGNLIRMADGRLGWINKPGRSFQDVINPATQIISMLGGGKLVNAGIRKKLGDEAAEKLIRKMAQKGSTATGAAGTAGAISAGQNMVANAITGEDVLNLQLQRILGDSVTAGVGQKVLNVMMPRIQGGIGKFFNSESELSEEAIKAFRAADVDPEDISPNAIKRMNQFARLYFGQIDDDVLGRTMFADSKGVRLRAGQATQDPATQRLDDMAMKGRFGERLQQQVKSSIDAQDTALDLDLDRIAREFGADDVGGIPEALRAARELDFSKGDELFARARQLGDGAEVPTRQLTPGLSDITSNFARDFSAEGAPLAARQIDALKNIIGDTQSGLSVSMGQKEASTTIRKLFEWRQRANRIKSSSFGTPNSAALKDAIDTFDNTMNTKINEVLATGDDEAIKVWREANEHWADTKTKWNEKFMPGVMSKIGPDGRLAVAPEDVANQLFGASDLGFLTKKGLNTNLTKLKDVLDEDSWNGIRSTVWGRMLKASRAAKGSTDGAPLSGDKAARVWRDVSGKNPKLINTLFSKEEWADMRQGFKLIETIKGVQPGGALNSSTGLVTPGVAMAGLREMGRTNRGVFNKLPLIAGAGEMLRKANDKLLMPGKIGAQLMNPLAGAQANNAFGIFAPQIMRLFDDQSE